MKGAKGNFQLAFGLVTYGDFLEEDYSAYGRIVAKLKKWSDTETTYFDELPIRHCTEAELGLTEDDEASLFFPIFSSHVSQVETYKKQLMCIDTPYAIKGDYSSHAVSHLSIQFEKCSGDSGCAEDSEIQEWLRRKFILTLRNEHNFYQGEYGDKSVKSYSKIKWYPINSQQRVEFSNEVQVSILELYDSISLGELTKISEVIF